LSAENVSGGCGRLDSNSGWLPIAPVTSLPNSS
jgi:hypothetical protein